jgi:hypothetical protein
MPRITIVHVLILGRSAHGTDGRNCHTRLLYLAFGGLSDLPEGPRASTVVPASRNV